ncbi:phage tail protein [Mesorhizobium sp. B2-8-9]|uniref:phage tail protein n=1 Tax=Mesorhizobium sp. B2-8-9 TaxID=2589899 RepID=UPI00112ADC7B|nr:phage tail protein [Mesorhizobium sp. B2-8-9]TPI86359.1 hypothetical protein FJ423_00615 [Mesorhizobium sp. B2-8-9]
MASEIYGVAVEGLSSLSDFDHLPDNVLKAARLAVNATARRGVPVAARSMERQVNFPRGYLTGQDGRLTISKFASANDLEARIKGRDRPTSLVRFVRGSAKTVGKRSGGVTVEVKPGQAKRMPGAFALQLKNGNIGLALRTKSGRPPSMGAKLIGKGLYLLYGPSVDQVFVKTREYVGDELETYMEREFERLVELGL